MKLVDQFTMHNDLSHARLEKNREQWRDPITGSDIFGPVVKYSWMIGDKEYSLERDDIWLRELPDATGFIAFESDWKLDNCVFLDVYGKERMRLTVPWKMTGSTHPESGEAPTSFANIGAPCTNPVTGEQGVYGVTAWVERASKL